MTETQPFVMNSAQWLVDIQINMDDLIIYSFYNAAGKNF